MNERLSPELLAFDTQLVEDSTRLLASAEARAKAVGSWIGDVLQLEVDRVRFMLCEYLRTRLRKIQKFPFWTLSDRDTSERLSESELVFAGEYVDLVAEHLDHSFLSQVPERHRVLGDDLSVMINAPRLDSHIFIKVLQDIGPFQDVTLPESGPILLVQDDQILMRYRAIQGLLRQNRVQLL
jgi:GINS complex subunit 4